MESVQERFDNHIQKHLYHFYWECLGLYDWETRVESRKNEVPRSKAILKSIEEISGIELKNKKMLDIGCGWGGSVVAGLELGADVCGCDVDKGVVEVAGLRSELHKVASNYFTAPAERLPFPNEHFDYVQSVAVLEHVDNVQASIQEMVRVLKKGGTGFIHAGNYRLPFEGHYKVLYPPKCPKILGKIYLALLGRPTKFLDTINYTDYKSIQKELQNNGVKVIDIAKDFSVEFQRRYQPPCLKTELKTRFPWTYNAIVTKVMNQVAPPVIKFMEKVFGERQIYFLIKKE